MKFNLFDIFDRRPRNQEFLVNACQKGLVDDVASAIDQGVDCNFLCQKYPKILHGSYIVRSIKVNLVVFTGKAAIGKNNEMPYIAIVDQLMAKKITAPAVEIEEQDLVYTDEIESGTRFDVPHKTVMTMDEVLDEQAKMGSNCKQYPQRLYFMDPRVAKHLKDKYYRTRD